MFTNETLLSIIGPPYLRWKARLLSTLGIGGKFCPGQCEGERDENPKAQGLNQPKWGECLIVNRTATPVYDSMKCEPAWYSPPPEYLRWKVRDPAAGVLDVNKGQVLRRSDWQIDEQRV